MKIILQLSMLLLLAATTEIASTCDLKPNGCSIPAKYKKWVGWKGTFTPACNKHDVCYFCVSWRVHENKSKSALAPVLHEFQTRLVNNTSIWTTIANSQGCYRTVLSNEGDNQLRSTFNSEPVLLCWLWNFWGSTARAKTIKTLLFWKTKYREICCYKVICLKCR